MAESVTACARREVSEEPSKVKTCIGAFVTKTMEKLCHLRLKFNFNKTLSKRAAIHKGGSFRKKKFGTKLLQSCFTFKSKASLYFAERIIY